MDAVGQGGHVLKRDFSGGDLGVEVQGDQLVSPHREVAAQVDQVFGVVLRAAQQMRIEVSVQLGVKAFQGTNGSSRLSLEVGAAKARNPAPLLPAIVP